MTSTTDGERAEDGARGARGARGTGARGRFVPVGFKLTTASVVLVLTVAAGIYTQLTQLEYAKSVKAKSSAARMLGSLFVQAVAAPLVFKDDAGITENVNFLKKNPDVDAVDVWAGAPDGALETVQSYRRSSQLELDRPRAPGAEPSVRVLADAVVLEQTIGDLLGNPIGVAVVRFSLARENAEHQALSKRILITSVAVALGLSLLLGLVSRLWIVRPLKHLGRAAEALQSGQRLRAGDGAPNDEIGNLALTFDRMADTLVARAQALDQRTTEMKRVLDNVEQGFLTLDLQGNVGPEWSAVLATWFGAPAAGQHFVEWLGQADERFRWQVAGAWEQVVDDILPVACSIDQLPRALSVRERQYALQWIAVLSGPETLDKVVVVVSDVTAERAAERAAQFQSDVLTAASKLVQDRAGFLNFLTEAKALVERVTAASPDTMSLARDIHTLKGNAAIFGVSSVAKLCHELESKLAEGDTTSELVQRLHETWSALVEQLTPLIATGPSLQVDVTPEELAKLIGEVRTGAGRAAILTTLEGFQLERAGSQLARLADRAANLAVRLGRDRPDVSVQGGELRLERERLAPLWSTLVHCVRNSVDHGIETPEQRRAEGKSPRGKLVFAARATHAGVEVEIADDGRGIDWNAVAAKATALGLPAVTRADLVDALFADGLSTREQVTDVSGRGVGLAALKATVAELGGDIVVESEPQRGTRFRFRVPNAPTARRSSLPPLRNSTAAR